MTGNPKTLLRAEFPPHLLGDHPTITAGDRAAAAARWIACKPGVDIRDVAGQPWRQSRLTYARAGKKPAPDTALRASNAVRPRTNTGGVHPRIECGPKLELGA